MLFLQNYQHSEEKQTELNISIFDLRGREIEKSIHKMKLTTGNHLLTIPVSDIGAGMYLMKINMDNRSYTELIVIR